MTAAVIRWALFAFQLGLWVLVLLSLTATLGQLPAIVRRLLAELEE